MSEGLSLCCAANAQSSHGRYEGEKTRNDQTNSEHEKEQPEPKQTKHKPKEYNSIHIIDNTKSNKSDNDMFRLCFFMNVYNAGCRTQPEDAPGQDATPYRDHLADREGLSVNHTSLYRPPS